MRFLFFFLALACHAQTRLSIPCQSKGVIQIPEGTFAISETTCPKPVHISGAGIGHTILKPKGNAFVLTGHAIGYQFNDLSFDMPATGNVFTLDGPYKPIFQNVEVKYPPNGTGKVFEMKSVGEPHIRDIMVQNAGYCMDVNGDNGLEYFVDTFTCENPGVFGLRVWRTTATDVGALWITKFKVTNPAARLGAQGILIGSEVPNTQMPVFLTDVTADGMKGADSLTIKNVNLFRSSQGWFTNAGPKFSPVVLDNVVESFFNQNHFQGQECDVSLRDKVVTMRMDSPKFASPKMGICFDSSIGKGNIEVSKPVTNGPLSNMPQLLKLH